VNLAAGDHFPRWAVNFEPRIGGPLMIGVEAVTSRLRIIGVELVGIVLDEYPSF
jgi:hypothetical protein